MTVRVDLQTCDGSATCLSACAFNAIEVRDGKAVVFENCTDCDACVRACPTHAISSSTAEAGSSGACLIVDVRERSGISDVAAHVARAAGVEVERLRVDTTDLRAAASIVAGRAGACRLIVLPHTAACVALAALVADALHAHAAFGCTELSVDAAGDVRVRRPRHGGIVAATGHVAPGPVVATLYPRLVRQFERVARTAGDGAAIVVGDAPAVPLAAARVLVVCGDDLDDDVRDVAHAIARSLGAMVADEIALPGATLDPDLCIAVGAEGSPETNAALRGARILVALVARSGDAIAQAADYALVGDVREHARALLAALV